MATFFQWKSGAYQSEFGGTADEAAHYVTGLMIHDYLAAGIPGPPMAYAQSYYDHYPKVALGNWPPLFYVMQALWSLAFSPSRVSILVFMALLSTLLATMLYSVLRSEFGIGYGLLGSALFLMIPLVQKLGAMVMTEIPIALWTFLSVMSWGKFLRTSRWLHAASFGFFASLTLLTKGSGMALAMIPPLTVLLSRRFDLVRRLAFWAPLPVVLLIAGPWTWKFRAVPSAGWISPYPTWPFVRSASIYYPKELILAVGIPLFLLALYGAWNKIARSEELPGIWHSAAASVIAVVAFQILIPCGWESRHLVPGLPSLVLLSVAGIQGLQQLLERFGFSNARAGAGVALLATVPFGVTTFHVPGKQVHGFEPIAQRLLSDPCAATQQFLVASDPSGEGQFIAEVAMRERRPGHVVRRASKALSSSDWNGKNYHPKYRTADELMSYFDQDSVGVLVIDDSIPEEWKTFHYQLLDQATREKPERVSLLEVRDAVRQGVTYPGSIRVYRILPKDPRQILPCDLVPERHEL